MILQVLLVASSLMTPADARSNTNLQKVRLFNSDALSKSALEEKWDRAKVVCTQPFNKSQPYGLSFISFITDDEKEKNGELVKSLLIPLSVQLPNRQRDQLLVIGLYSLGRCGLFERVGVLILSQISIFYISAGNPLNSVIFKCSGSSLSFQFLLCLFTLYWQHQLDVSNQILDCNCVCRQA